MAKMSILDQYCMKTLSARDAKNRFGYLIDTARQEPVSVEKHGRPVVVVLSIEDYERLTNAAPRGSAGEPE
jgi:prevent-host-death family protein|tara:strand:- start:235 stop:447 length:213 start_codon:yes stop_codon:yes gene_type:complete